MNLIEPHTTCSLWAAFCLCICAQCMYMHCAQHHGQTVMPVGLSWACTSHGLPWVRNDQPNMTACYVVGILSGGKSSCEIMQHLGCLWVALDRLAFTCSSTSPTLPHSLTLLLLTCCRTSPALWKPPLIHCQSELLLSLSVLSHLHGSTWWLLRTKHDATTISPCGC